MGSSWLRAANANDLVLPVQIIEPQTEWLTNELKSLSKDVPLLVALHHPIYSADDHHSGSTKMKQVLETAADEAGRHPDMVLAGHVHNYQRFTRTMSNRQVPYIVAGAGGYWHLHYLAKQIDGKPIVTPFQMPDNDLMLEQACDDRHGFMRLMLTQKYLVGEYWTVPRPQESWRAPAQRIDAFELDLQQHKLIRGTSLA